MEKKVLEKKWKVSEPITDGQYYRDVMCGNYEVCTSFNVLGKEMAERIVKDHNEMLKLKKQAK